MKTYAALNKALGNSRERILEPRAKVRALRNEDKSITVWMGTIPIVHHQPDGAFTLKSGDVRTPRLIRLLNKYSPVHIITIQGVWFLEYKDGPFVTYKGRKEIRGYRFFEGIEQSASGVVLNRGDRYMSVESLKLERRRIKTYAFKFIEVLAAQPTSNPWDIVTSLKDSGCAFCTVRVNKDTTLGEVALPVQHRDSHIVNHYRSNEYPLALLCRAVERADTSHRDAAVAALDKFMKKKAKEKVAWTALQKKLLSTILMNYMLVQRHFALTTSGI
jgi:hypothetical protein